MLKKILIGIPIALVVNDKVGEGRVTILESNPSSLIAIKLEFIKPFESLCTTKFAFEPSGDKTNVTWSMAGQNNFIANP